MFKLVISDDEGKTTVVPLVRDEITIGRKEGNTIRLTERNVSRRHARLRKANGVYVIEDLNSYNGVKINGRRIEGERPLAEGDQITIGDYTLALQSDASAGVEAPAAGGAPAAGPVPPARLVMLTPPAPGAEFALTRSGMRIGRAEDLDVWVNHRSISREHAEVRLEGELIKVVDLGSANGVRLNGEDVREATLSSGDVLELGQVRFRYVGAGEAYVFEADRTVQMDALQLPEEPTSSKVPLIAAAVIVLVAVGVGAAIALSGGETPETGGAVTFADPSTETPPPDPPPTTGMEAAVDPSAAAVPLVERCRQALEAGDLEGAQAAASQALELAPGHAGASECAQQAQAAAQVQAAFDRGVEALEAERYDEAYFAFEELPEDSPLRRRPEVQLARDRFASFSLERARESLEGGDRALATSYANNVLSVPDLPAHFQNAANEILRQARATGGGTRRPRDRRGPRDRPETTVADRRPLPPPPQMEAMVSMASVDPGAVLRECSYNQRCVAQRLAGRANTPAAMGILIEAYKSIGDSAAARRTMQQLISRFPNSRQANQYRRQL